eukprot:jgi/Mesen1/449/ME000101S10678
MATSVFAAGKFALLSLSTVRVGVTEVSGNSVVRSGPAQSHTGIKLASHSPLRKERPHHHAQFWQGSGSLDRSRHQKSSARQKAPASAAAGAGEGPGPDAETSEQQQAAAPPPPSAGPVTFLTLEEAGLIEMTSLEMHERFLARLTVSSLNLLRIISEQEGVPIESLNAGIVCDWFTKDRAKREEDRSSAVLQW